VLRFMCTTCDVEFECEEWWRNDPRCPLHGDDSTHGEASA
jgi:hypothetical protein